MFKKININYYILFIVIFILQGCCMGAMILGTTAVATKTIADPRSIGTQIDDGALNVRINYALSKDQQLKNNARIISLSYQGKVLLCGQAPNKTLIKKAKQIVMNIHGVTNVYNEIRLGKPIELKQILLDTLITTQVRLKILTNHIIHPCSIKISTENREVFLIGIIKKYAEGKVAAEIASQINGVRHVITIFNYAED